MEKSIRILAILCVIGIISSCGGNTSKIDNHTTPVQNATVKAAQSDSVKKDTKTLEIKTIKIGSQVWMIENLNVTTFRNGEQIPEVKTDSEWALAGREGKPAWCYYNNEPNNGAKYGKLYNWYAVTDRRGLAPDGWNIPTEKDWNTLINHLGDSESDKIKSKTGWEDGDGQVANGNGSNSSGFSAVPSGYRNKDKHANNSGFDEEGSECDFWTSNDADKETALAYFIYNNMRDVFHGNMYKGCGFSVRCIEN